MAEIVGGEQWQRIDSTAESVPGVVNASPTWKDFRVVGGGFGLRNTKQTIDTTEEACNVSQPAASLSHHVPRGTVQVIPSPHDSGMNFGGSPTKSLLRFLLDWAITRTSGVLSSHSIQRTQNDIVTQEFSGLKVNTLEVGFDAGGGGGAFLQVSADLLGRFGGRLATALGSGDCGTLPSSRHWIVAQCSAQIGDDLTVDTTDRTLRSLRISISNNLKEGAPTYQYAGASAQESIRRGLQEVTEGDLKITGSFEITLTDDAWFDRYMESDSADLVGAIRLLCFHPDSTVFTISGAGFDSNPASDATCTVSTDPSSDVTAGTVAYFEDADDSDPVNHFKEVLQCQAPVTTSAFTVDLNETNSGSLGRDHTYTTTGTSRVYTKGFTLMLGEVKITDWEPVGNVDEKVRQRVTFEAQTPSGWTYPIKWLVR